MGFRIEVEGGDATERLLEKLQTSPTGIFPSAFSGYLLFLFTGRERQILQQFRNEISDLDSLTGETLAFAIFVERLSVTITDVTSGTAGHPATREFDAAALKKYYSISGLVRAGKVGWVSKDTELVALTSATNKIATELGVLSSLPCIVAFDGTPNKEFKVVSISEDLIPKLVPVLRRSIDRLRRADNYSEYSRILKNLQMNEEAASLIEAKLSYAEAQKKTILDSVSSSRLATWEDHFRPLISTARRVVKIKELVASCFLKYPPLEGEKQRHIERITKPVEESHPQRRRLHSTLEALAKFEGSLWPLEEADRNRLDNIVTRYVEREFLGDDGFPPGSLDELVALKEALQGRLDALTESLLLDMCLDEAVREYGRAVARSVEEREAILVANLKAERNLLDQTAQDLLTQISRLNASFSDIFCDEIGKTRVSALVESLSSGFYRFLRPWIRPQTLVWAERLFQHM